MPYINRLVISDLDHTYLYLIVFHEIRKPSSRTWSRVLQFMVDTDILWNLIQIFLCCTLFANYVTLMIQCSFQKTLHITNRLSKWHYILYIQKCKQAPLKNTIPVISRLHCSNTTRFGIHIQLFLLYCFAKIWQCFTFLKKWLHLLLHDLALTCGEQLTSCEFGTGLYLSL